MQQALLVFFLLFQLLTPFKNIFAQPTIQTEISASSTVIGGAIQIQLKVDGITQGGAQLILPKVNGLHFSKPSQPTVTSQTIITNGHRQSFSGLVYNIELIAEKIGQYTIPGIKVEWKGIEYQGKSFQVRVVKNSTENTMKIELRTKTQQAYIQEPIDLEIRWYLQESLNNYEISFPLLLEQNDLRIESLLPEKSNQIQQLVIEESKLPFIKKSTTLNNENYTVYIGKIRLYAFKAGKLEIPKIRVQGQVQRGTNIQHDFFGRAFRSPQYKNIYALSKKIDINIKPLPKNNPKAKINNGIGLFKIRITSETKRAKVGDPIELKITITGKGLLEKIEPPLLSEVASYQKNFTVVENLQPGDINNNSITFTQVIRAKNDRVSQIPPIPLTFFDTVKEEYITIKSNHLPIKILPATKLKESDIYQPTTTNKVQPHHLKKLNSGIRGNYIGPFNNQAPKYIWLITIILPPFIYLICLIILLYHQKNQKNPIGTRSKKAYKKFQQQLKTIQQNLNHPQYDFYQELHQAIMKLIADKFNLGQGELTSIEIEQLKYKNIIQPELSDQIINFMEQSDRLRFLSQETSQQEKNHFYQQAEQLSCNIVKELKGKYAV